MVTRCTLRCSTPLAEVQSQRRGKRKKTKIKALHCPQTHKTAVLLWLTTRPPHIKATAPFHRARRQQRLWDTLPDATVARCALIRNKLQSGGKHSGTVCHYKNCDFNTSQCFARPHPPGALPLFSQLLLPQCSPWTQQWRWMKAEVFIMRAIRKKTKLKTNLLKPPSPTWPRRWKRGMVNWARWGQVLEDLYLTLLCKVTPSLSFYWCLGASAVEWLPGRDKRYFSKEQNKEEKKQYCF